MGGCRCVFRDCDINTAHHPNMHFFKFPVNEEERFKKWVNFSGAEHILQLKPAQQLNRAVCGRHFRDEAFMNYKKDRLCRNQIPTITRISETHALNYEDLKEDGTPKLITLKKATLPHLIGPPGFVCPLGLPPDNELVSTSSATAVTYVRKRSLRQESDCPSPNKKCRKIEEPEPPLCNIINKTYYNKSAKSSIEDGTTVSDIPHIEAELKGQNSAPTKSAIGDVKIVFVDDAVFNIRDIEAEIKGKNISPTCDRISVEIKTTEPDLELKEFKDSVDTQLNLIVETHKTLKLSHVKLTKEHKDLRVAHDALKMKCDELEKELKLNKSKTTTVSAPPAAPAQQLTKSQLFHGIKRYLCSSMTTLVRMEMFGSSEREWKPDERLVSTDLMRLGDNVYKFFLDEWRVRMPSFREVHSWLSKAANTEGNKDEEVEGL